MRQLCIAFTLALAALVPTVARAQACTPARCLAGMCTPGPCVGNSPEDDCDGDGATKGVGGDCNDNDCTRRPLYVEICDGVDNNCVGGVDEGLSADADSDGVKACGGCNVAAAPNCDCNDTNAAIKPGAAEACDNVDNNCNGQVDENVTQACACPGGSCTAPSICRGGTRTCAAGAFGACVGQVTPAATETCDALDNNCNGQVNEGLAPDADGDGVQACGGCNVAAAPNCDCNDNNANIKPGVAEACDNVDNNCNGQVDENVTQACACPGGSCTAPSVCRAGTQTCTAGAFGACAGQVGPSGAETCDNLDNNCNGQVDEGLVTDADGDGARTCTSCGANPATCDCDDNDAQKRPGLAEVCDNKDNNCDGTIDNGAPAQRCYSGPANTHTGTCPGASCNPRPVCAAGTRACVAGSYGGACVGEVLPAAMEVCNGLDDNCNGQADEGLAVDMDGDGRRACGTCGAGNPPNCDCNDNNPNIYNGRAELCNNIDDNCNGQIDENVTQACACPGAVCGAPSICRAGVATCVAGGFGACTGQVGPAAVETCNNLDDNCNGQVDEGLVTDADGDGVRSCTSCGANPATCDCDDTNNKRNPTLIEVCDGIDNDCDNLVDERNAAGAKLQQTCPAGGSTTGVCRLGTQDCNAAPNMGTASFTACMGAVLASAEVCDGLDNNCNGTTDEGFDGDGDGFVDCTRCPNVPQCDCNDTDPTIKPNAVELCDTIDQNCNGQPNDVPDRRCFSDAAGVTPPISTYSGTCPGASCQPKAVCQAGNQSCQANGTWGTCAGVVLPSPEVCDLKDNNCDGAIDEGNFDADGDGVVSCALCASVTPCDCNDADPAIKPGAPELCDGKDNNCDGTIDGLATACYTGPMPTLGVGICRAGSALCMNGMPSGTCAGQTTPGVESCNGLDDNCDGKVDEGFDADGDGAVSCALCPGRPGCDCDDADAFNSPSASEICDCKDNNCSGTVDEGQVCRGAPCHDFDSDGITNCQGDCNDGDALVNSTQPERANNGKDDDCDGAIDEDTDEDGDGYTVNQGDCNDKFREVNPGQVEACDGFDNNCNGQVDEGFDKDGDFATTCTGDCDDNNPARSPFRKELCSNQIDDNCNGLVDEDLDSDGDGVTTCAGDCNDFQVAVHPSSGTIAAAMEICDGQDNDCNGQTDEGFDLDGDRTPVCFNDCDDTDPNVGPDKYEIPGNLKDDNCNGQVDEGTEDKDMDGFSPICGDCNDSDSRVNPHAKEICDRIDNNCDSYIDSAPGKYDLCSTCFDADKDGVTNCDGDCNDADPMVFRGAVEVCDGKDNDCEGSVDLDGLGRSLCVTADGGVDGGGTDAGVDAGSTGGGGGGTGGGSGAGGQAPPPPVVSTGCSCGTTEPGALMLGLLALLAQRRRRALPRLSAMVRRGAGVLVAALLVGGTSGCQSALKFPPPPDDGVDGGEVDAGPRDAGFKPPVSNWDCGDLNPIEQLPIFIPGTQNPFAVGLNYQRTEVLSVNALLLDDPAADVAAFVLKRELPPDVDITDPTSVQKVGAREVAALDRLLGSPLVTGRTERFSRVYFGPAFVAAEEFTFAGPTQAASVRNRLLASLSGKDPSALGQLPVPPMASSSTQHVAYVMVRILNRALFISAAVSPASKLNANLPALNDLTNGSHVGGPNAELLYNCEHRKAPQLKSDFLFVIDNSGSMLEEQRALVDASDALFAAFQASGIDFRIGVVTTDGDVLRGQGFTSELTQFKNDVQVGISGNGTEMGLEFGLRAIALAKAATDPKRKLREDAGLVVVVVSDERNTPLWDPVTRVLRTPQDYAREYNAQKAVLFAIVGPNPTGCQKVGLGRANAGTGYIEVAVSTGGSSGSICNPNLNEVVEEVLFGALGASSRSPLENRPISGSMAVKTTTFVPRARTNGFDYDPAGNTVLFFGSVPAQGASFDVAYSFFATID